MSPAPDNKRKSPRGSPVTPNGCHDNKDAISENSAIVCDHEHFGMALAEETFNINIDELFTMIFTDSPLFQEFIRRRRTFDVNLGEWSTETDEQGCKIRNLAYTLSINYSIGPKSSPSTEKQMMYPESQPGERYLIDAECYNGGVPYSDRFCTVIRYCMTRLGPSSTRLIITGRIVFLKSVLGMIKSLLQKTAISGCTESFGVMVDLLRQESRSRSSSNAGISGTASRPSSLPTNARPRFNGVSDIDTPSVSSPSRLHEAQSKSHAYRRMPTKTDSVFVNGNTSHWTSDGMTDQPSSLSSLKSFLSDSCFSIFSAEYNADTVELLVILLFIVVLALVLVNFALYYQVSTLEAAITKSLVFQRGGRSVI